MRQELKSTTPKRAKDAEVSFALKVFVSPHWIKVGKYTMHGVKRSRVPPTVDSAEVARKKQEKEQLKIDQYTSLVNDLIAKSKSKDYTEESLNLTTQVLDLNPEYTTGWSTRRRILRDGILLNKSPEDQQNLLEADLQLTNRSLKMNPKNYNVWEHRKWVLETMPAADWAMEMKLVEAYLEKDARNFHSWDYRRYLVSCILKLDRTAERAKPLPQPTTASELEFTRKKIANNFSNFSAWHYRTKLLTKLFEEEGWAEDNELRGERIRQEFDLVKQAIWSDPADQSAWLYHRWLVGSGSVAILREAIYGEEGFETLLEEAESTESRLILDALMYYKRLLVSVLGSEDETRSEREKLNLECLETLKLLQQVDPMRKARYQDLAVHILPHKR